MMRELVLQCTLHETDPLSDALLEAGALSVSVEDADSDQADETPLFGEPGLEPEVKAWRRNQIVALVPDDVSIANLLEHLRLQGVLQEHVDCSTREVPDHDWVRMTQAQFGPIQVGSRVWITPSWHEDAVQSEEQAADGIRLRLDPGLAFGTGSHPTTHLCLEWLAQSLVAGSTVLDYGCGSGVLAIAARLLGAGQTIAVDIDPQAVEATRKNAQRNHVTVKAMLPDALVPETFEVVLANILSNPLKVLAPMLAQRVCSGGQLILSGVLRRQAQEVIAAYTPWIPLRVWQTREDWVCLHGEKP